MIDRIEIKNFQSHKQTDIKFVQNGVNVLVGSSDMGKSAILRALIWTINNRPSGTDDVLSHWARDKKGKIVDELRVKVSTENGAVVRRRTAEDNEYELIEKHIPENFRKVFKAVSKDVPDDVRDFFKLTDVNIQSQHDAPFLLSSSPSDVAKYFNKIVRLDVIDKVLSNAESSRREHVKKLKGYEQEKVDIEKELASFDWIESAERLVELLNKVMSRMNEFQESRAEFEKEEVAYQVARKIIKNFPNIKTAKTYIDQIEKIDIDYTGLETLDNEIQKYRDLNKTRKVWQTIQLGKAIVEDLIIVKETLSQLGKDMGEQLENIKAYEFYSGCALLPFDEVVVDEIIRELDSIRPDYDSFRGLHKQIQEYETSQKVKEEAVIEQSELHKQLPDTCPTCGAVMKEGRKV